MIDPKDYISTLRIQSHHTVDDIVKFITDAQKELGKESPKFSVFVTLDPPAQLHDLWDTHTINRPLNDFVFPSRGLVPSGTQPTFIKTIKKITITMGTENTIDTPNV